MIHVFIFRREIAGFERLVHRRYVVRTRLTDELAAAEESEVAVVTHQVHGSYIVPVRHPGFDVGVSRNIKALRAKPDAVEKHASPTAVEPVSRDAFGDLGFLAIFPRVVTRLLPYLLVSAQQPPGATAARRAAHGDGGHAREYLQQDVLRQQFLNQPQLFLSFVLLVDLMQYYLLTDLALQTKTLSFHPSAP